MQKNILLFSILLYTIPFKAAQQNPQLPNNPPINLTIPVTVNVNADHNSSSMMNAETRSSAASQAYQTTTISVLQEVQQKLYSALHQVQKEAAQSYKETQKFIATNKTNIITGIAITSCLSLIGYLQYQYYCVYTKNGWVYWSNHLTLTELVSSNIKSLTEKLMKDIHLHYVNKNNVQDVVLPYTMFIHEIEEQINAASSYLYFYQIFNACYVTSLFGLRQSTYNQMKEAHTRLLFIKNLFMSWICEQTLSANTKS